MFCGFTLLMASCYMASFQNLSCKCASEGAVSLPLNMNYYYELQIKFNVASASYDKWQNRMLWKERRLDNSNHVFLI